MAPKAKKEHKAEKETKSEKKAARGSAKAEAPAKTAAPVPGQPGVEGAQVDPDELEEQEEADAEAASSQNNNAAALAAAAGGPTEMSASFKNFRHHPDMENFYRFIYENDLRHEALAIIDEIMVEKLKR